jgi:hypothetical protein
VNGKAIPQPSGHHFAEAIHQRLAGMGAQVVHDQMDGLGGEIVRGDIQDEFGKLGGRSRWRHFGEMQPAKDENLGGARGSRATNFRRNPLFDNG